jgi:hypothetical protein
MSSFLHQLAPPYANTDMMSLFLKEVAQDFKDYFVVMLVDQSG